jgi:hypothetical protein
MLSYLKSLFQTPHFPAGARVNLLTGASSLLVDEAHGADGRVMTQTDKGVLVDWPRSGMRWVNPHSLCQQA